MSCARKSAPKWRRAEIRRGRTSVRWYSPGSISNSAHGYPTSPQTREAWLARSAPEKRAQGMPDAKCARSLACKIKKHTSIVTTVTPGIVRHSLREGEYRGRKRCYIKGMMLLYPHLCRDNRNVRDCRIYATVDRPARERALRSQPIRRSQRGAARRLRNFNVMT